MSVEHFRFAVIADLSCRNSYDLLTLCSTNSYFNGSYRWLMFAQHDLDVTVDFMETQNLNIDSSVTIAVTSEKSKIDIFEMYGTVHKRGGRINAMKVAVYSQGIINWECSTKLYSVRSDLKRLRLVSVVATLGTTLNVTLEEHLRSLKPARSYAFDRFTYQIVQLLRQRLNFKVDFLRTRDYALEAIGTNSTSGIIGQLQQNLVDFSIIPMAITAERIGSFDQTVGILDVRIMTVFRHPKDSGVRHIFLKPFENLVWVGIGVIVLVSIFVLAMAFGTKRRCSLDLLQCATAVAGMICQQGSIDKTAFGLSRIATIAVVVFSILIYQFYSCYFIGYFLVLPPKTIRTLEQLITTNIKVSVEDLSYNRDFFKKTKIAIARELYDKKISTNEFGFTNVSMGIAMVKQGGHAFHCDTTYGYRLALETFTEQEICDLQEVYLYPVRSIHINLPKGSPLKEPFRVTLRRLKEIGLMEYYTKKLTTKRPACLKNNSGFLQIYLAEVVD
uniref:Ionotropic receptor 75a N-terminal domain-containing protein n=2 Tax=Culex quinquefasciatus TaxID=7176 RepID=A0A1S4J9H4_CULQU